MARIKVIDKVTGKTGTIEDYQFDKNRYEYNYGGFKNTLARLATDKNLPLKAATVTGIGAIPVSGPLAIAASGATAGMTRGAQDALQQYLGMETPSDKFTPAATEFAKGATSEAIGQGTGWAANKVLSPVLGKVKGLLPEQLQNSSKELMGKVGEDINSIVNKYGDEAMSPETISKITDELNGLKTGTFKYSPDAISAIDDVIKEVSNIKNFGEASVLARNTAKQVMTKKGFPRYASGVEKQAEQAARRRAGVGLTEEIGKQAPEYSGAIKDYQKLSRFTDSMNRPESGLLMGGLVGMLGKAAGVPGATGLAAGATILSNPYLRFLAQKTVQNTGRVAQWPARPAIYGLLNLLGGQQ